MTRFARAKGSKASNERVPEAATSWQDMKKDLLNKNEANDSQTSDLNCPRKTFNNAEKQDVAVKWSEFPDMHQTGVNHKSAIKTKKQFPNQEKSNEDTEIPAVSQKKKKRTQHKRDSNCFEDTSNNVEEQNVNAEKSESSFVEKRKNRKSDKVNKKIKLVDHEQKMDHDESLEAKRKSKVTECTSTTDDAETNQKQTKLKKSKKQKEATSSIEGSLKQGNKSFEKKGNHGEYKRRKPNSEINKIFINGSEIEISYYDGFPIKKIDADRLKGLKKEMISRGLPRSEIAKALKLERRKAEKALAREKKKVCFNCRKSGHTLSECPLLKSGSNAQLSETGICFKCGSTEHTHFECKVTRGDNFKFAQCFICQEQGHIARQCPDNNKGLYPKGGACRICGDVTHLKKDCPKFQLEQEENKVVAHTIDDKNIESLENENAKPGKKVQNSQKVIKF